MNVLSLIFDGESTKETMKETFPSSQKGTSMALWY
jgi:hypothetical protein